MANFCLPLLLALVAVLPAASGAPVVEGQNHDQLLVEAILSKHPGDDHLALLLARVRSEREAEAPLVVAIVQETAKALRKKLEDLSEQLVGNIKSNSPRCGTVDIKKVDAPGDIPSYYYKIDCPENCPTDKVGLRVFRSVGLDTIYFRNRDGDQYEVGFRHQVVGCCLEDSEEKPILSEHPIKLPPIVERR